MLFPEEGEYREWMERAGFTGLSARILPAPWDAGGDGRYVIALAGTKHGPNSAPLALGTKREDAGEPMTVARRARFALRFVAGSLAGAAFVPLGALLMLRARLRDRSAR